MSFGARQYDPQLGRFLSVDPMASADGQDMLSPYHAMGNNPVSMVDPGGLSDHLSDAKLMSFNPNIGLPSVTNGHYTPAINTEGWAWLGKWIPCSAHGAAEGLRAAYGDGVAKAYEETAGILSSGMTTDELEQNGYLSDGNGQYYKWIETTPGDLSTLTKSYSVSSGTVYWRNDLTGEEGSYASSHALEPFGAINNVGSAIGDGLGEFGLTNSVTGIGKTIGRYAVPVEVGIDLIKARGAYINDGHQIGYNTQKSIAGSIGGLAGAWAGFKVGAWAGFEAGFEVGAMFEGIGAIPGSLIGAFIGGITGAIGGGFAGEAIGESIISK